VTIDSEAQGRVVSKTLSFSPGHARWLAIRHVHVGECSLCIVELHPAAHPLV
jgi:hypothetical protein